MFIITFLKQLLEHHEENHMDAKLLGKKACCRELGLRDVTLYHTRGYNSHTSLEGHVTSVLSCG